MNDALTYLTIVFSLVSTSLLIPVMLGLLYGLLVSCVIFGRMIREMSERLAFANERRNFVEKIESQIDSVEKLSIQGDVLAAAVNRIIAGRKSPIFIDNVVAQSESLWQTRLEMLQTWTRIGPSLGLMGTLIPLGPGLIALADGDLAQLSANLIIVFATTVVGVLIALICGCVHSIRKRWYRDDAIALNYFAESVILESDGASGFARCRVEDGDFKTASDIESRNGETK